MKNYLSLMLQLFFKSEMNIYLHIMLCYLFISRRVLSFYIYSLGTCFVIGTALGAGELEVKYGPVNSFQQRMLWGT